MCGRGPVDVTSSSDDMTGVPCRVAGRAMGHLEEYLGSVGDRRRSRPLTAPRGGRDRLQVAARVAHIDVAEALARRAARTWQRAEAGSGDRHMVVGAGRPLR
jgi:hypothetical protein